MERKLVSQVILALVQFIHRNNNNSSSSRNHRDRILYKRPLSKIHMLILDTLPDKALLLFILLIEAQVINLNSVYF